MWIIFKWCVYMVRNSFTGTIDGRKKNRKQANFGVYIQHAIISNILFTILVQYWYRLAAQRAWMNELMASKKRTETQTNMQRPSKKKMLINRKMCRRKNQRQTYNGRKQWIERTIKNHLNFTMFVHTHDCGSSMWVFIEFVYGFVDWRDIEYEWKYQLKSEHRHFGEGMWCEGSSPHSQQSRFFHRLFGFKPIETIRLHAMGSHSVHNRPLNVANETAEWIDAKIVHRNAFQYCRTFILFIGFMVDRIGNGNLINWAMHQERFDDERGNFRWPIHIRPPLSELWH